MTKDINEIHKEFEKLQVEDRYNYATIPKDTNHTPYNRYRDILPYIHSQYKIKNPRFGRDDGYINANIIKLGNKRYIATQGPLKNTINRFWEMIFQELIENEEVIIVMLTELEEMGREKCYDYISNFDETIEKYCSKYGLLLRNFEEEDWDNGVEVRRAYMSKNGYEFTIEHYWVREWPDFGIPNENDGNLEVIKDRNWGKSVIVHCSAGVGRSGTFIASDYLYKFYKPKEGELSKCDKIYDVVSEMRKSRVMMVQKFEQYEYLYRLFCNKEESK